MDRNQLITSWGQVAESGNLLISKHDPNDLGVVLNKYRSVISYELSSSLEGFIKSGEYTINQYADTRYPGGSGYFEIIPNAGSTFSVPGSGVPAFSTTPTEALDRLIMVYGYKLGWHVHAETSSVIQNEIATGRFSLITSYTP